MTIKVCHMTSAHNRYDVRIFEKECTTLMENNYDITLLVNDDKEEEILNGIKIKPTGVVSKTKFGRMFSAQRFFYKKALEIDAEIYHFHDPELLPIGIKLKKKNKKVIFDSHEHYYEQIKEKKYIPKVLRKIVAEIYLSYETSVVKRIDAVIFPCSINGGKNPFEGRSKKTVFINNVPKLEEFYNHYSENPRKGEFKICYVGSLTYNRGVYHSMKACFQVEKTLILAGMFSPKEFQEELASIPEYKCVDYRGYVDRLGVLDIYKESDLGICTLLDKGQYFKVDNLSTKVYEYMSMGLPVIVSNSPYANKILKEYEFGISVKPEDIEEIIFAIDMLKNNPEVAKTMGENGRRAIKGKYNWEIEERKLLSLYKNL